MRRLFVICLVMWLPLRAMAVPQIQHWTTGEGLRVYFVPTSEIPMVDIQLVFDAGSSRNQAEKAGLARMTAFMLNQGAGGRSADEMAAGFERLGAGFGAGADTDMATLSLRSLSEERFFKPAFGLFLTAIGQPDFPQADFERGIRQFLIALEAEKADPGALAQKSFSSLVYGSHPYGLPDKGDESSLKALTVTDVREFYERYYVAKNGTLAMVGDISREQAETLATRISATLKPGGVAADLVEVKPLVAPLSERRPFPSKQAHVLMGAPGISRNDPDRFAVMLGNHMLGGGGFTSRLVKEVRQDRGYAYSVYSYFIPMRERGPFTIGMQTRGSQVDDAINVVRETLKKYLDEGPTDEEFEAAKSNITGSFPLRIAGNGQIVRNVSAIGFFALPLDYLDHYIERVEALKKHEVMEAMRRHLNPDRMVTVVVGGSE